MPDRSSTFPDPKVDYRKHPELYRIGRGERGVLTVEPYKSELLPHWRFKTPADARTSSRELYQRFKAYLEEGDFAGADMARKFIQMGWTRSRRYANHAGGRKYKPGTKELLPNNPDPVKAESAAIFFTILAKVRVDPKYKALAEEHKRSIRD